MYLAIWIVLILLGIIYKKSKKIVILQMIFIVLIITELEGTADYGNYLRSFYSINENVMNIFQGNILFNISLYLFGFANNYSVALFFISAIVMIILYQSIAFYTDKISLVFSFYLMAPFVIDAIQLKNFIAMVIWFYFSRFLYNAYLGERKRYNACMYVLGVTISLGFHFSFIIMYFFVLIPWLKLNVCIIFAIVIGFGTTLITDNSIINFIIEIIGNMRTNYFVYLFSKFNDYINNFNYGSMNTRLQITGVLYFTIIILLVVLICLKKRNITEHQKYVLQFLIMINIMTAIIFPFMSYSMEIYRVQRNLLLINYTLISGFDQHKVYHDGKIRLISIYSLVFCIIIASFYLYFDCIYWNYKSVFAPLFKIKYYI